MTFPAAYRAKLDNTNPIERLNGELKRRSNTAGIVPNETAVVRLVGALLREQSGELVHPAGALHDREWHQHRQHPCLAKLSTMLAPPNDPTCHGSSHVDHAA